MVAENLPSRVSGLVKRSLPSYSTPETGRRAWFAPRGSTPAPSKAMTDAPNWLLRSGLAAASYAARRSGGARPRERRGLYRREPLPSDDLAVLR